MNSRSLDRGLRDILSSIRSAGAALEEWTRTSAGSETAAAELSVLHEYLKHPQAEARIFAVHQLAHKSASTSTTADLLVAAASSDPERWVRYAAMASLLEHRAFANAAGARIAARASSDKVMRIAERDGTKGLSVELEAQFRKALARVPDCDPLELALEVGRMAWPELLLKWSDVRDAVNSDQRDIENALLAKRDTLRFSSEALFVAEDHLHVPAVQCSKCKQFTFPADTGEAMCCGRPMKVELKSELIDKYGKPTAHLVLVNARDVNSFHDEDPFASIPITSLEHFGSAYGLGSASSSFERYVGLATLFWPMLRKHSSFVSGARGKRTILVGVHHPEEPPQALGIIEVVRPQRV